MPADQIPMKLKPKDELVLSNDDDINTQQSTFDKNQKSINFEIKNFGNL